jgi:hypothetical protein
MKKILMLCLLPATIAGTQAQTLRIDSVAILILDRMSSVIGDLNACSFRLQTSTDVPDNTFFIPHEGIGLVKHFDQHEVYIDGPDKMLINSNGDKGHRGYWYNGEQIAYYSYTENNFGYVPAPGNVVEAIHEVNERYGIEFPAGDFFFPSFVDDLIQHNQQIIYLGTTRVMGKRCFHIVAAGEEKSTQFWISDDGRTLPVKMVVVYLDQEDRPQYEATFTDWRLNPDLPATLFEFLPPPNARELTIVPRPEN